MRTEDAFKIRLANCSRIILVHTGQCQERGTLLGRQNEMFDDKIRKTNISM